MVYYVNFQSIPFLGINFSLTNRFFHVKHLCAEYNVHPNGDVRKLACPRTKQSKSFDMHVHESSLCEVH